MGELQELRDRIVQLEKLVEKLDKDITNNADDINRLRDPSVDNCDYKYTVTPDDKMHEHFDLPVGP